jgi:BlaI family transcriptional regulator, penicillinase repressor
MEKSPRISESEWQVMKVVWAKSPITTNEVVDALTPTTTWKPKTIMTLLKRLVQKGALGYEKKGRVFEYYPKVGEEECARAESQSFLQKVYGGTLQPMLAHFLSETDLSKEDIAELKRILDERSKRK